MHASQSRLGVFVCQVLLIIALTALPGYAQITLASGAANFGVQAVSQSSTTTLTYVFSQPVGIGAPVVVTQGTAGLDFTTSSGTCAPQTYSHGQTCTVDVTFTPLYPGLRMGAVVFSDTSGAVISTTFLQGIGDGSLPTRSPVSSSTGLSFRPLGVAVDAAGYIYVLDPGDANGSNGAVRRFDRSFSQMAILASGFTYPVAEAVDGAGNVYVADYSTGYVWKVAPGGLKTQIITSTNLDPNGLAVDGAGNLYIADRKTESVLMVAPDGTQFDRRR